MKQIFYILALLKNSLGALRTNRLQFLLLSGGMALQNAMFMVLWVIFFHVVHDVHGWQLTELGVYQGVLCIGIGTAFFLGQGARYLGERITMGEIDSFLVRPRHPLPQLLSMEANGSSLGDVVYGIILLLILGQPGLEGFGLALIVAACVGIIFLAMVVIFQSMAFFIKGGTRLAEEFFVVMICMASVPQNAQGMFMKLVLFSILPAGFMGILPVEVVRQYNFLILFVMIAAALFYTAVAVAIFKAGLRRYTSATGWKV